MAATPIYTNNLELFLEADQDIWADTASYFGMTDYSGKGRNFVNTGATYPTMKFNAVPTSNKKAALFGGSAKPLVYSGAVNIRCGFMVAETTANPTEFGGLLTAATDVSILVTNKDTNNFVDVGHEWYEYRLNDRISNRVQSWANGAEARTLSAPAPAGAFGIIYFKFWNNLPVTSLQIGQQTNFTARKLSGEVALLALYSDDLTEDQIRKQMQSISFHYKIPIADVFPFAGSRGDTARDPREVLTDGQKEPHLRVRDSRSFRDYEANFGTRSIRELQKVRAFGNSFYPDKTFLFRNCNTLPPEDTPSRFAIPTDFARAENLNLSGYQLNFVESLGTLNYTIPAAAPVLD